MLRSESLCFTFAVFFVVTACDSGSSSDSAATGGVADQLGGSGGTSSAQGGASMGGATSGGSASGGSANAGSASGGASSGGAVGSGGGAGSGGAVGSGGTAGSSGATSGGAAGASAGSGGSTDVCAKAIFCDDFEKYAPGKAPDGVFKSRVNGGTVSVDESQRVSGTRSVKFTTEGKDGTKTAFLKLEGNSVFPVAGNAYYGRMMFLLESAPTTAVHWTLVQSTGIIAGQTYRAMYRYGGQHPVTEGGTFKGSQLMANYETPDSYSGNGPRSDCWFHANKRIVPVGKWTCLEWKFDGPNNQMRLWMDGVALDDLSVNGVGQGCVSQPATYPWTAPNFENVEFGWEAYQNDAARTLYVDDLVISKEPIGCP